MKDKQTENQKLLSSLNKHLIKWKAGYELLGHFLVLLAVIVALISVSLSRKANEQTNDALIISRDALKIQRNEFYLRNRPFILIRDVKFSVPATMPSGNHYEHTIFFSMTNASSIPANSMIIEAKVFVNDKEIRKTVFGPESLSSDLGLIALPPNSDTGGAIGLTQKEFEISSVLGNNFYVKIGITYNGILGTPEDKYHTSYVVVYNREENMFKMTESKYN